MTINGFTISARPQRVRRRVTGNCRVSFSPFYRGIFACELTTDGLNRSRPPFCAVCAPRGDKHAKLDSVGSKWNRIKCCNHLMKTKNPSFRGTICSFQCTSPISRVISICAVLGWSVILPQRWVSHLYITSAVHPS